MNGRGWKKKIDPLEDWDTIPEESHVYVLFSMFYGKYPESVETILVLSKPLLKRSRRDGAMNIAPSTTTTHNHAFLLFSVLAHYK